MSVTHRLVVFLCVGATLTCCISANSRFNILRTDTNELEGYNQIRNTIRDLLVNVTTKSSLENVSEVSTVSNRKQDCLETSFGSLCNRTKLENILDRNKTDQNTNFLLLSGGENPELPSKLGECDVITLAMCRQKKTMYNNVWNITCVNDTGSVPPKIALCSNICLHGRRDKCEDLCPEYLEKCPQPSTTSLPTTSATIQWPDGPRRCDVTTNMCRVHFSNKNSAWRDACTYDKSQHPPEVQSCLTICRISLAMCEDICSEYLKQCLPTTTTMVTTSAADSSEWMYGPIHCNVTVSMCQQQPTNKTLTWRVACFFDTSSAYLNPEILSCADVCLPVNDPHPKCADLCKEFLHYCYPPTTTTEHTHVNVTSEGSAGLTKTALILIIFGAILIFVLGVVIIVCYRRIRDCVQSTDDTRVSFHVNTSDDTKMLE